MILSVIGLTRYRLRKMELVWGWRCQVSVFRFQGLATHPPACPPKPVRRRGNTRNLEWNISKVGAGSNLGHVTFCRLGWAYCRLCWVSLHSTQPTCCRWYFQIRNPTTADFKNEPQRFLSWSNWTLCDQRRRSCETTPKWRGFMMVNLAALAAC